MSFSQFFKLLICACTLMWVSSAFSHGNVTPQPVDTGDLPDLGQEALTKNPFREGNELGELNAQAIEIGESAYAGNCAGCHGIEAQSGGLTPDLRELTEWDDEFYVGRVMNGTARGMPSFKTNLGQTAIWSIRTYVESVSGQ
ncbi:Quinohemoprotein alcohol dehydrogenase ADH-IIG [Zhongshania aliphaticivorans]|uniref:Quinohemoprotein alcohol dehydrogenase ADH-IIG n=1 Tax=Zhongshania aliphaticivorans TaxID=1470434 RepID=A0A5S9N883_9GAMM|nr:cytochrome c-550 PedF [Zhongshania aliphaticivorans]CAA0080591.1 Quinohemoprotein alcohol dehydrogenase ADH-IIG [Zhongshania aliphaticivorans]CAA0085542.1 Quinohemoprotein alcohol dehydrogenase ADH-IIG [Zhongshania aliphaticivorans]